MPESVIVDPASEAGKKEKEIENRVRENLRAEYARKEESLNEELTETKSRLEELENKVKLTEAEKREAARLEKNQMTLEDQIVELESKPEYKAFYTSVERRDKKTEDSATERAKFEVYLEMQKDFLEEKAEELSTPENKMDWKKLADKLKVYEGRYSDKNPMQRARLCFRDYQKEVSFEKREADLKAREDKASGFREGDGRLPREKTLADVRASGDVQSEVDTLFPSKK